MEGKHYNKLKYLNLLTGLLFSCGEKEVTNIDLSGKWSFKVDPLDKGAFDILIGASSRDIRLQGSPPPKVKPVRI
ncbi:MAG: hypothetical protein ABFS32_08900 [Bacteroidota bacterium]